MAVRTTCKIIFTQQNNSEFPTRGDNGDIFTMDFVNELEVVSTWLNLADTAKLKFPRNIYVINQHGDIFPWTDKNIYGGSNPLFMRGDKISIDIGYWFDNFDGTETLQRNKIFEGYISKIRNRMPIEIQCEDEMWRLKKIHVENKIWLASQYSIQSMVTEMLAGTGIKVQDGTSASVKTIIGDFRTQNETVAQVLDRLKKEGNIYSYFRDGVLRCSGIVYYPEDRIDSNGNSTDCVFRFQNNIISDSLEYTRKEDLNLALKVHAEIIENSSGKNNDGTDKTKKKRLEVMIDQNGKVIDKKAKFFGDMISIPIITSKAVDENYLIAKAREFLPKYYYTGFRGSFDTYLQPVMKHGFAAILEDDVITERWGTYLVKEVKTIFNLNKCQQIITPHLRIDEGFTNDQINSGI